MPVPDQVPKSHNEPSESMRRQSALKIIREKLPRAVLRIHEFIDENDQQQIQKKIYLTKTDVKLDESSEPKRVNYVALFDYARLRILIDQENSMFARPVKDEPSYKELQEKGADESEIVTFTELMNNKQRYTINHLFDIAHKLDTILPDET